MPYTMTDMVLYFFAYSFIGWLMETVLCSVRERHFINRGFLNGPLCPIYGCGVLLILIFLLPVREGLSNPVLALPVVFIAGAGLASAVEFITSWLMEKLFHARWWDYSAHRYNLEGRICLSISLAWGCLAAFLVYILQPLLEALLMLLYGWGERLPMLLAILFGAAFLADCAVSVRIARALGNKLEQMEKLGELVKAHLEGLERPAAADLDLKLEAAYDRFAGKKKDLTAGFRLKAEELRGLNREELAARLRRKADELSAKRSEVMGQIRGPHKRLLRAFPTMKRTGESHLLEEIRHILKK